MSSSRCSWFALLLSGCAMGVPMDPGGGGGTTPPMCPPGPLGCFEPLVRRGPQRNATATVREFLRGINQTFPDITVTFSGSSIEMRLPTADNPNRVCRLVCDESRAQVQRGARNSIQIPCRGAEPTTDDNNCDLYTMRSAHPRFFDRSTGNATFYENGAVEISTSHSVHEPVEDSRDDSFKLWGVTLDVKYGDPYR